MQVAELLDRAKGRTGSDGLTAKALGATPQRLSQWRHGSRPCPAEVQDRLCVLGELTDAEIAGHVIERAGLARKKTTAGFAAGFAGSLATGVAAYAEHLGRALESAAMYIANTRQKPEVSTRPGLGRFERRFGLRRSV